MKRYKNITDEEIQAYLESSDLIENYYIRQLGDDSDTAMLSVIKNGTAYSIMDDDDERVEVCLDFLRRRGAAVLKTLEEEDAYIEEFNHNNLRNLQNKS